MIHIDPDTCNGCAACVRDCVFNNLALQDKKAKVIGECIQCGHCVAICPQNAVWLPQYDMADVEAFDEPTFTVPPENFLHLVKYRRSIRQFQAKTVEEDRLYRILQAGRYTATAVNLQDVRFVVIRDALPEFRRRTWLAWEKVVAELKDRGDASANRFAQYLNDYRADESHDRLFLGAPVAVVLAADIPLDAGLAAANVENMAVCEGLGALYNGYVIRAIEQEASLADWLGLGDKKPIACLLLGYAAVRYARTAPRRAIDQVWL